MHNNDLILLIEHLRTISNNNSLKYKIIVIPNGCEQIGFVKGEYKLSEFLHFVADIIE